MTPRAAWLTTVTLLIAMLTYTFAESNSELVLLMIPLLVIARYYSHMRSTPLVPQWVVAIATFFAVVYAGFRVLEQGPEITVLAEFVAILAVLKSLERWTARDDMQLLIVAIFLMLASAISSSSILIGFMLLIFVPLLGYAAMRLQIEGALRFGQPKDERLKLVKADDPDRASPLLGTFAVALILVTGISVVAFVMLPRGIGGDTIRGLQRPIMGPSTGFRNSVQLGRGGLISQDQTIVMEVEVEQVGGREMGALGVVYHLRGTALTHYENGRWESELDISKGDIQHIFSHQARSRIPFGGSFTFADIKQTIHLAPNASDGGVLFTLWQPLRINFDDHQDGSALIDKRTRTARLADSKNKLTTYTVISSKAPRRLVRLDDAAARRERDPTFASNETLRSMADALLERENIVSEPALRPASRDGDAARVIERWLADSGEFTYTLDVGEPDSDIDPIEWFLTEARTGHCEYYASAMAALCRSVGVNARVITGYIMAEYDSERERYIVRRSNAHAWVEAEVSPGVWETFDPTPNLTALHTPDESQFRLLRKMLDAIDGFWLTKVVSFDERNQMEMFGLDRQVISGLNTDKEIVSSGKRVLRIVLSAVIAGITGFFVYRWYRRPRLEKPDAYGVLLPDSAIRVHRALVKYWKETGRERPPWAGLIAHASTKPERELATMLTAVAFGPSRWDDAKAARARELLDELTALKQPR